MTYHFSLHYEVFVIFYRLNKLCLKIKISFNTLSTKRKELFFKIFGSRELLSKFLLRCTWELSGAFSVVQRIFSCRKLPSKLQNPIKLKNTFFCWGALHIDLEAEESASHPTLLPCLSKGGAARTSLSGGNLVDRSPPASHFNSVVTHVC